MSQSSLKYRDIIEKLKGIKNIEIIIAIVIIAIIVSLYTSTLTKPKDSSANKDIPTNAAPSSESSVEKDSAEAKLIKVLEAIEGAGRVQAMITYESGPEVVPAMDVDKNDTNTQENDSNNGKRTTKTYNESNRPVTIQQRDGTEPLILKERMPEVRGVIVIAEGARDIKVKMDLLRAVETVLKVPADRVEVFTMAK